MPEEGKVTVYNKETGETAEHWTRSASEVTGYPDSPWTLDPPGSPGNPPKAEKPAKAPRKAAKKSAKKGAPKKKRSK
jgi:hypothetical protein